MVWVKLQPLAALGPDMAPSGADIPTLPELDNPERWFAFGDMCVRRGHLPA